MRVSGVGIPASAHLPLADDVTLVEACKNGDRGGQRDLYERHCQRVYRLMYRMVGPRHADDLTQQVFLRVLQSIGQFAGRSTFPTWLYRLATNEALQFLRRNDHRAMQAYATEPIDALPSTCTRLDDRDMLEQALASLDPDLRSIFLLREVEGLSYYELALVLDVAEGTVASESRTSRVARIAHGSGIGHDWNERLVVSFPSKSA